MQDFEQTILQWAPVILNWIAKIGLWTAVFSFIACLLSWFAYRITGDKSLKLIHALGVGLLVAFIPGLMALLAFAGSKLHDYAYIQQSEGHLASLVREYLPGTLVIGVFLLGAAAITLIADEIHDFAQGVKDWLRGRHERQSLASTKRSGLSEGFRRLAIVVGIICGLVGAIFGAVIADSLNWSIAGLSVLAALTALFYGAGWLFICVIGWVVATRRGWPTARRWLWRRPTWCTRLHPTDGLGSTSRWRVPIT